ncbi:unnamed protein product [Moneuplotes crassus]|uniref:Uncharacterized protein n=1 Tax=Euplotes crassus TaxID=5936 RepID=A0AAD1UPC7_EUPCR|nr:unnamed protein product [Moneuplotes crassus]
MENFYEEFDEDEKYDFEQDYEDFSNQIAINMKDIRMKYPAERSTKLYSNGKKKLDPAIYTGTGGNLVLYYKLLQYGEYSTKERLATDFLSALEINCKIINSASLKGRKCTSPSFFQGSAGIYTMACLFYHNYSEDEDASENFQKYFDLLIQAKKLCFGSKAEDEILYGNAGYLYCLLTLYKLDLTKLMKDTLLSSIEEVALELFKIGSEKGESESVLLYSFPREEGKPYLGGAHGLIGILYMLLEASKVSSKLSDSEDFMETIQRSCNFLVDIQLESGNFPNKVGDTSGKLLHFCHGAPGAIPLLILASEIYTDEGYLKSAEKAGEIIWERGLLLKGFGVCHGISGNAYVLHSLYRATGDLKWRYRAQKFAKSTCDDDVKTVVYNYETPSRLEVGLPDSPYSLMEGISGNTVMLIDMVQEEERDPKFPGYEI